MDDAEGPTLRDGPSGRWPPAAMTRIRCTCSSPGSKKPTVCRRVGYWPKGSSRKVSAASLFHRLLTAYRMTGSTGCSGGGATSCRIRFGSLMTRIGCPGISVPGLEMRWHSSARFVSIRAETTRSKSSAEWTYASAFRRLRQPVSSRLHSYTHVECDVDVVTRGVGVGTDLMRLVDQILGCGPVHAG